MWKELGNLLNSNRTNKNTSNSKLIINNKNSQTTKTFSNTLNTHFATIGKILPIKLTIQENNSFKATITRCDLSPRFFCIDATLLCEFESDKI